MKYILSRIGTGMGVGWFACVPQPEPSFEDAIAYSREHPNDLFMRRHLLSRLRDMDTTDLKALILKARSGDGHLLALSYETCLLNTRFDSLRGCFEGVEPSDLIPCTPMIVIPSVMRDHSERHFYWLRQFSANANLLRPLPSPAETPYPIPFDREAIQKWREKTVSIRDLGDPSSRGKKPPLSLDLRDAAKRLTRRMEQLGILTGWEMRTEATLSPFAVERPWNLHIRADDGRNQWELSGTQTGYGRGLNISMARISCLMEIVERYSAFASMESGKVRGYAKEYDLIHGSYDALVARNLKAVPPDEMCLEVPYQGQAVGWIEAERISNGGAEKVYVPAQMVFLFSNLDEACLTSGLSSNGLAAGETPQSARLSALLEVIERDAEKVIPYDPKRCFLLAADDDRVSDILETCRHKGIHIQFMDITPETGIPCYKAFVQGPGGVILKGTGAHLDGKRAIVAALTEIPYPYPYWFGSMPLPEGLETRQYEDLPDYASGDPVADLGLLERVLLLNGYAPIYIDLARENLGIPVMKALVPGLEMMTVFDRFSPLGLRQFGHYLNTVEMSR